MSRGVAVLSALAIGVAIWAPPAHAKLSDDDKRRLVELGLQWAIDGGIADFKMVKDPSRPIVSARNLPAKIQPQVPGHQVVVLSPLRIQARADIKGDFLYFQFSPFSDDGDHARVAVALVWAVAANSPTQYLSGGGAVLDFEKRDGKWVLLPVSNRWMS